jgi:hypothetical protein
MLLAVRDGTPLKHAGPVPTCGGRAVQARGVSCAVSPVSKLSEDSDVCVFRGDASPLYLSDSDQGSR